MNDLKQIFAKNLVELRAREGMTQLDLGEKLNYSDKTVSKWERGESIPDASVLKEISELFHISLDDLLSDHTKEEVPYWETNAEKAEEKRHRNPHVHFIDKPESEMSETELSHQRTQPRLISQVAITGLWVLTLLALVVVRIVLDKLVWMIPVYTLSVSFLLCIIFNSLWGTNKLVKNWIYISLFIFSIILCVYLQFVSLGHVPHNLWMLFLLMIPVEILLFFVFRLSSINKWFWKQVEKRSGAGGESAKFDKVSDIEKRK